MAIGFEYKLGVDESSSLESIEAFIGKIEGMEAKLKLSFDASTIEEAIDKVRKQINDLDGNVNLTINNFDFDTSSIQQQLKEKTKDLKLILKVEFDDMSLKEQQLNPGETIKKNFEKDLELMKDSMQRMLNNLKAQMDKANIGSDIIDINAIKNSIDELNLTDATFAQVKEKAKEIKNDIQAWQQAIKLNNNLLTNTGKVTDDVRKKMQQAGNAMKMDDSSNLSRSLDLYKRRLDIQKQSVTMSRQFNEASEDTKRVLQEELNALKVNGNTMKELAESYQEASVKIREMKGDLKASHIEENGYAFNNLANSVKNLALQYISLDKAFQLIEDGFRSATQYILDLDDAYTDISISMEMTRDEFDATTKQITSLARESGVATNSIMDMVKIYATAGEDINAIFGRLQGTTAIQNVTQFTTDRTTNMVNSVINQFKLMDKEINGSVNNMEGAINYFGDALINISNALSIDNVKAIQEMSNAIDDAGGMIESAGGSMEWFMAISAKMAETMNMTGNEVAAAMRMITARSLRQGEAVEAMGESAEDLEYKMAKAEKALTAVGTTIRGETGDELLSIEEILTNVAGVWDKLSDSQRQYVADAMAGTNRMSTFINIMENYNGILDLQGKAHENVGALMEASNKRAESLQGRIDVLKDSFNRLFATFMNSQGLKSGVTLLDDLLQVIIKITEVMQGKWAFAIGAATTSLIAFNIALKGSDSWVAKFIDNIYDMGVKLGTLATTLGTAKLALLGFVGILGGVAVAAIAHFVKKGQEKKEMLEGMTQAIEEYNSAAERTTEVDTAISDYEKLHNELRDMNTTEERRQVIEQEIAGIREQLSTDERYKNILEQENALVQDQLDAMREINDIDRKNNAIEAYDKTDLSNKDITDIQDRITNRESYITRLNDEMQVYNQQIADAEQRLANAGKNTKEWKDAYDDIQYYTGLVTDNEIERAKAEKEITEKIKQIIAYQEAGVALGKEGFTNDRDALDIIEQLAPLYEEITGEKLDLAKLSGEELETEKQITEEKQKQSEISTDNGEADKDAAIARQKELNEQYVESLNKLQEASELIEKIQDGISLDDMNTILNSDLMDGFVGSIDNAAQVTEHLKGKLQEMQDKAYEAYGNMKLADQDFWNNAVTQCARALGVNEQEFINYIDSKGLARNVDVTNASSAANAELQMNVDLINQLLSGYAGVTNDKAGYRKVDMSNVVKFLNTQGQKEGMTVDQLTQIWANFYNAKKKAIQAELSDLKKQSNAMQGFVGDPTVKMDMDRLNAEMAGLEAANSMISDYFSGVNTTFQGITNGLAQSAAAAGKAINSAIGSGKGSGSSGGSGGSGSSSSATQKEVADMESLVDRYYQLNDAIRNVTKSLEKNRQAQANVKNKKEYKKLINDEISLINKEITAMQNLQREQQKERDELKWTLQQNGFAFDGNNNITNYAKRLQEMTNYANSLSDPDQKEAAIAHVKAINDIIERYTKLEDETIPDTSQSIEDLKNDIIDINKEMQENLKLIDQLGDRYFDVLNNLADIDNKLSMNDLQQSNENGLKKIQLMKEEILLLGKKQELLKQQQQQSQKEANDLKSQLEKQGLKFDANGNITNYEAFTKQLTDNINNLYGDSKDEAQEAANDLLDLIDRYMTLTDDTIPDLIQQQQEYAYEMEDINEEMKNMVVDIQKQVTQAYENELNKRYSKLQENLKKEQDALNKAYEEESYQKGLNEQQRALDEIAQQIAIYSRDTSEAGKARLEQLKREYEQQQQAINDSIRENEKTLSDERFEEEGDKLDNELADLLAPEKLIATVNDAITSGMITVGDEVIKLDDLMTNWIDETGDGMYALGGVIKDELLANLQGAKTLMQEMGLTDMGDLTTKLESMNAAGNTGKQSTVNFNDSLVKIESMSNDVDVNNLADTIKREVYQAVNDAMK